MEKGHRYLIYDRHTFGENLTEVKCLEISKTAYKFNR